MFFKYLFISDGLENTNPLMHSTHSFIICIALSYAFLITNGILKNFKHNSHYYQFAIWFLLIFLISPYGSSYARVFLLTYLLFSIKFHSFKKQLLVAIILLGVCNFPYLVLKEMPILLRFPGLYGIILLFLLELKNPDNQRLSLATFCIVSIFFVFNFINTTNKRVPSGEYLTTKKESLILSYTVEQDKILYDIWNGSKDRKRIPFSAKTINADKVTVEDGQLYLDGTRLTNSFDNKKQPMLVNENKIVYLSDWGRGYGFYTLRILKL